MTEWKDVKLGEVSKTNTISYSLSEKWDFVNYLDTGNVTQNVIDSIQFIELKKEKLPSRARRKVRLNDIIYSTVRPNQQHYGRITKEIENLLVSTGFAVITVDPVQADSKFIYYVITQKEYTERLQTIAEQNVSTYPSIKPSDLEDLIFSLPPLDVQRKIAGILGALDDKIEVLRAQNKTLEQMAQAVFQSWFVDFDIVRAKAAGLPAADVCKKYHITPDIYDIFPSAFTPDNLPLGWEKKKLGDVCRYSKKKTDQTSIETYISTDNMNSNYGGIETASSVPDNGQSTCYKKGNILISNIRPYFKKIWYADKSGSCSNDVLVFIPKDFGNNMLYLLLARDSFFDFVMTGANGAKMPRGDKKHIMTYPVVVPNKDITVIFETLVTPFFEKIFTNQYEIACLIKLRDILLQKLISNDVDVGNVSLVS